MGGEKTLGNPLARGVDVLILRLVRGRSADEKRAKRGIKSEAQLSEPQVDGVVAQLVERLVRNEKVRGSTPLGSTILRPEHRRARRRASP